MGVQTYQPLADALALPPLAPPFKEGWQTEAAAVRSPSRALARDDASTPVVALAAASQTTTVLDWSSERAKVVPTPISRLQPERETVYLLPSPLRGPFAEGWVSERFKPYPVTKNLARDESTTQSPLSGPPLAPPFREGWTAEVSIIYPLAKTLSRGQEWQYLAPVTRGTPFAEGWTAEVSVIRPVTKTQPRSQEWQYLSTPPLALPFNEGWQAEMSIVRPVSRTLARNVEWQYLAAPPLATFKEGWSAEVSIVRPVSRTVPRPLEWQYSFVAPPPPLSFPEGWQVAERTVWRPKQWTPPDWVFLSLPPLAQPFKEGWQASDYKVQIPPARQKATEVGLNLSPVASQVSIYGWETQDVKPGVPTASLTHKAVETPLDLGPAPVPVVWGGGEIRWETIWTYVPSQDNDYLLIPGPLAPPFKEGWQADNVPVRPPARTLVSQTGLEVLLITSTPPSSGPFRVIKLTGRLGNIVPLTGSPGKNTVTGSPPNHNLTGD